MPIQMMRMLMVRRSVVAQVVRWRAWLMWELSSQIALLPIWVKQHPAYLIGEDINRAAFCCTRRKCHRKPAATMASLAGPSDSCNTISLYVDKAGNARRDRTGGGLPTAGAIGP